MITTAEALAKLRAETVAALLDYYDHPVTAPDGEDPTGSYTRQRGQQDRDAKTMVARAIRAGISMRQLAADAHLPGTLVINLIEDDQRRADAYAAEIYHLERSLAAVRDARARDARARARQMTGDTWKTSLAQSYGVTRPTLYKMLEQPTDDIAAAPAER